MKKYDIAIIGGGITGTAIARELSKYDLKVCLLEKNADVATGSTKANSGIVHGGYAAKHGSTKAKFCAAGNRLYTKLNDELNFGFSQVGSYVIGFDDNDAAVIKELYENGLKNGAREMEIVDGEFVRTHEPHLNPEVSVALYCKSAGITSPYEFAIALAENAVTNGVELFLNSPVSEISKTGANFLIKTTNNIELETKIVINAAGLFADEIAGLVGLNDFTIRPRQGEYLLFDKDQGSLVNSVIFQTPTKVSKGTLVTCTHHGNLLVGPDADYVEDKDDLGTIASRLAKVVERARLSLDSFDMRKVITSFSGNRAASSTGDFVVGESEVKGFINVAGIESPGLTAAPAIAEHVVDLVANAGVDLKEKADFNAHREAYKSVLEMPHDELAALVAKEPSYGRIICRCETVSEGEIIDALHRPIPITTLDAVKRRVRAGMGRCQGGFCSPKLLEIISRELNIPYEEISKKGHDSELVVGRTKEGF